jgi:hypothetical protein
LEITKELAGEQKRIEKPRQQRKATNNSKPHPWLPKRGRGSQRCIHKVSQMDLVTGCQFHLQDKPILSASLKSCAGIW